MKIISKAIDDLRDIEMNLNGYEEERLLDHVVQVNLANALCLISDAIVTLSACLVADTDEEARDDI